MKDSLQPYKGARDFYPEDMRFRKWMFGMMRSVVERYGYEEYDASIIEPTDLYRLKNQTNQEIVDEQIYTFVDRGGRDVALRPEMTPTVSRMVAARRQELAYPLRWYSIPNLWRYERPQRGRLREHWQLNVDVFGIQTIAADLEMIEVADAIMQAFHATRDLYDIRINSRMFMDYLLREYIGLDEVEASTICRLIDKMHKMDYAEFGVSIEAVMNPSQREDGSPAKLLAILAAGSVDELPEEVQSQLSFTQLEELINNLRSSGISNVRFDPTLMRGFDYYTDIIFEVFDTDPLNNRSMFGGGRYDGLVGQFGVEPIATVGFGMGDVTLENFLRSHNLAPQLTTSTELWVIDLEDNPQSHKIVRTLRDEGVCVAVDVTNRKISKQIDSAVKKGIPYLLVIGEQELQSSQFKLRTLSTGNEETHGLERIISLIKDQRRKA